jgi:diguanylate cyclase (GGDEF)-like protein
VAQLLDRVERQRREAEQLRDSANLDALTGLINRRGFDSAIDQLLRGRRERDAAFSMLMLDLDHFKDYNDDFGHQAGDDVLRQVGRLLRAALRPADLPARYGGEEFALLLPETDLEHAHGVAERVLADFRAAAWPLRPVTVSIGVAEAHRSDDARELIRRADEALYAAKHGGRDRVVVAAAPGTAAGPAATGRGA